MCMVQVSLWVIVTLQDGADALLGQDVELIETFGFYFVERTCLEEYERRT